MVSFQAKQALAEVSIRGLERQAEVTATAGVGASHAPDLFQDYVLTVPLSPTRSYTSNTMPFCFIEYVRQSPPATSASHS